MIDDTVLDHLEIIICCWDLLWRKIQVRIIQVWWWIRWKLPILMWPGTLTLAGRLPPSSATQTPPPSPSVLFSVYQTRPAAQPLATPTCLATRLILICRMLIFRLITSILILNEVMLMIMVMMMTTLVMLDNSFYLLLLYPIHSHLQKDDLGKYCGVVMIRRAVAVISMVVIIETSPMQILW